MEKILTTQEYTTYKRLFRVCPLGYISRCSSTEVKHNVLQTAPPSDNVYCGAAVVAAEKGAGECIFAGHNNPWRGWNRGGWVVDLCLPRCDSSESDLKGYRLLMIRSALKGRVNVIQGTNGDDGDTAEQRESKAAGGRVKAKRKRGVNQTCQPRLVSRGEVA